MANTDRPAMPNYDEAAAPLGMGVREPRVPGFNAIPTPMGWLPLDAASNLAAYLTPSKHNIAEALGGPVDSVGWMLHWAGLPIPGGEAPLEYAPAPGTGRQPWIPSAGVPLSSRNIRSMLENPPDISLEDLLQAARRPSLF